MNKKNEFLVKNTDIKIFKTSNCKFCTEEFIITDLEKKLLDKEGFKYPEHCSLCNFKLLYSFINDTKLYKTKDFDTKSNIISNYGEYYDGKVIDVKKYKKLLEDDEFLKYGIDIGEDIFSDFIKLSKLVPRPSRLIYPGLENADYSSHSGWAKNVYLSFCVFVDCENVFNSFNVLSSSKNIFYSTYILNSSNIYTSNDIRDSFNIFFSDNIKNSSNLLFCKDLENSKECIFSCNKVNAEYLIFNKQYSKKKYNEIKKEIFIQINQGERFKFLKHKYENFLKVNYIKSSTEFKSDEKVTGHKVSNSKNLVNAYSSGSIENGVNLVNLNGDLSGEINNVISCVEGGSCTNMIGSCSFGPNISSIFFSFGVTTNANKIYYSYDIESCEEIMFSLGLKNKKYCILNKQYSKEEYFRIKKVIISKLKKEKKWGDPLPNYFQSFPYNDTSSYMYFGVHKIKDSKGNITINKNDSNGKIKILNDDYVSDATIDFGSGIKHKIKWRNKDEGIDIPKGAKTIDANSLPPINEVTDDILAQVIVCNKTEKPFRIMKKELDFFKKYNLPLPQNHYSYIIKNFTYKAFIGDLKVSKCDECKKEVLSTYENKYKMYCNECYNKFMYS